MTGFHWLVSYPKSGNTWLRLALASLTQGGAPPDFSDLSQLAPIAGDRNAFDDVLDVESSDLTETEIQILRPRFYEAAARASAMPSLRKVHDAWILTAAGDPLFPPTVTLAAVYIARDPRDVAVSLADHLGKSLDDAIGFMADPDAALAAGERRGGAQLPQRLLTWSGHVQSWLDAPGMPPPLLLRYEDMVADAAGALLRVARHLGVPAAPDAVMRATAATRFEALRTAEEQGGFPERSARASRFFRRGAAGGWRDSLSSAQAARIMTDHAAAMARLGYG